MSGFSLAARFPRASEDVRRLNADLSAAQIERATPAAPPPAKSPLAVKFEAMWEAAGGPAYVPELRFHNVRRFRFDYAWPAVRLALELQGGIYRMGVGGHGAADRMKADCDKLNLATTGGWRCFKLATGQVTPENVALIRDTVLAAQQEGGEAR